RDKGTVNAQVVTESTATAPSFRVTRICLKSYAYPFLSPSDTACGSPLYTSMTHCPAVPSSLNRPSVGLDIWGLTTEATTPVLDRNASCHSRVGSEARRRLAKS